MNGAGTKCACGLVAPDGSGATGVSFKIQKIATGIFEALFNDDFHEVPAASVARIYPCPMDNNPNGGDTWDNAVLIAIGADWVGLKTSSQWAVSLPSPRMGA
jgi:hypothetical protein